MRFSTRSILIGHETEDNDRSHTLRHICHHAYVYHLIDLANRKVLGIRTCRALIKHQMPIEMLTLYNNPHDSENIPTQKHTHSYNQESRWSTIPEKGLRKSDKSPIPPAFIFS